MQEVFRLLQDTLKAKHNVQGIIYLPEKGGQVLYYGETGTLHSVIYAVMRLAHSFIRSKIDSRHKNSNEWTTTLCLCVLSVNPDPARNVATPSNGNALHFLE